MLFAKAFSGNGSNYFHLSENTFRIFQKFKFTYRKVRIFYK